MYIARSEMVAGLDGDKGGSLHIFWPFEKCPEIHDLKRRKLGKLGGDVTSWPGDAQIAK